MFGSIWVDAGALLSALHVLGPVAVRYTMRFSAGCNPTKVAPEELPGEVADVVRRQTAELAKLGYKCAGCYDCGTLTRETRSYVAYFRNPATNDLASVCALVTAHTTASYLEFSTSFTNGMTLATNTNRVLPLTPGDPAHRIFRFSRVESAEALYSIHRRLLAKYAIGWWPQGEPEGDEIRRYARAAENYGPRHQRIGYMRLTADRLRYELTWKGACLMTWRRLWPTSIVRRLAQRCAMALELHSLDARGRRGPEVLRNAASAAKAAAILARLNSSSKKSKAIPQGLKPIASRAVMSEPLETRGELKLRPHCPDTFFRKRFRRARREGGCQTDFGALFLGRALQRRLPQTKSKKLRTRRKAAAALGIVDCADMGRRNPAPLRGKGPRL